MSDSMFKTVLSEVANAFCTAKRDNDKIFYKVKNDAPEWIKDNAFMRTVHEAVDGRLPDDWIYEQTARIAETLEGYDLASADDARNVVHEVCDGLVDVYNNDRLQWLALHLGNADLCDEAADTFGIEDKATMFDRIGLGQFYALDAIANSLINQAESEAESRGDE